MEPTLWFPKVDRNVYGEVVQWVSQMRKLFSALCPNTPQHHVFVKCLYIYFYGKLHRSVRCWEVFVGALLVSWLSRCRSQLASSKLIVTRRDTVQQFMFRVKSWLATIYYLLFVVFLQFWYWWVWLWTNFYESIVINLMRICEIILSFLPKVFEKKLELPFLLF